MEHAQSDQGLGDARSDPKGDPADLTELIKLARHFARLPS